MEKGLRRVGEKWYQTIVCVRPNNRSRIRKRSFAYTQTQTQKSRHTYCILTAHFCAKYAADNTHEINKLTTSRRTRHTLHIFKSRFTIFIRKMVDNATRKWGFHLFCRRLIPLSQQLDEDYAQKLVESQKSPYLCIRFIIHALV